MVSDAPESVNRVHRTATLRASHVPLIYLMVVKPF